MTCCRPSGAPLPYWPGGRCDMDAPLAEDSPWVVYDNATNRNPVGPGGENGRYAEKTVGTVVITCEAADGRNGTAARLMQPDPAGENQFQGGGFGMPQGAKDINALGVVQQGIANTNSVAALRFTVSVVQPRIQARVIDLDRNGGVSCGEAFRTSSTTGPNAPFGGVCNMGEADRVIPFRAGPFGNPSPVFSYQTGGGLGPGYRGDPAGNESSALLTWNDRPWGDGTTADDMVIAWILRTCNNASGGRSMYDFGGPIFQEECTLDPRYARLLVCCGDGERLVDSVDGHTLTPEEAATIEGRRNF